MKSPEIFRNHENLMQEIMLSNYADSSSWESNFTPFEESIIEKAKQERVIPKDYAKDYISREDSGDVRDPWN